MKNKIRQRKKPWSLGMVIALSCLILGCVSKKKYEAALQRNAKISVDKAFQEYDHASTTFQNREVIYNQKKELRERSQKLDSLERIVLRQKEQLSDIRNALAEFQVKYLPVSEADGKFLFELEGEVYFNTGSNDINSRGKDLIKGLATAVNGLQGPVDIWVIGHTDDQPFVNGAKDNWQLSSERAIAVVRELVANNVDPSYITASAKSKYAGEEEKSNSDMPKYDRRTEIIIQPSQEITDTLFEFLNTKS